MIVLKPSMPLAIIFEPPSNYTLILWYC